MDRLLRLFTDPVSYWVSLWSEYPHLTYGLLTHDHITPPTSWWLSHSSMFVSSERQEQPPPPHIFIVTSIKALHKY